MGKYLNGRYGGMARLAMGVAALILVPICFLPVLPVWEIHLRAPQYNEGLVLKIYAHTVGGDIQKVNTLNHYVGMKAVSAADFKEFAVMPALLSLFGLWAGLAALWGRRWFAILGWVLFAALATALLVDFGTWLVRYGTELDPRAPLKLGTFAPPLIGVKHMGNFQVASWPSWGGGLLLLAGALGPLLAFLDWRASRRGRNAAPVAAAVLALLCAFAATPSNARAIDVPVDGAALTRALAGAQLGDTLRLGAGTYRGTFECTTPLALLGHPAAAPGAAPMTVLDGGRAGTVLTLMGGAYHVADLAIRHGGASILRDEAGIHLATAPGSLLERLWLDDTLHGVYLERAGRTVVRDVRFHGKSGRVSESDNGNAIHLWYSPGVLAERCDITGHRDGVYISFCKNVTIRDSRLYRNDRYGLHYMYSDSNTVENCRLEQNVAGAAIMFSHRLRVVGNRFRDNSDQRAYGLLLRDCNDGRFEHNEFEGNTIAIFLDGAQRDTVRYNRIADNDWGLSLFASSKDVLFERNDLIGNRFQVATDLRRDPNTFRENYWDDARGYDLDGDGRADRPHRPVALFAFLSKRYPDLALFAASPAIAALTAAERTLPALAPSEIADPCPAMRPWTRASADADDPRRDRGSWPLATASALVTLLGGTTLWLANRS